MKNTDNIWQYHVLQPVSYCATHPQRNRLLKIAQINWIYSIEGGEKQTE